MNVFELAAVLTLNKDSYDKGMKDAEKSASGFGDKLAKGAKIGAAGVAAVGTAVAAAGAALVKGASETAQYGDEIDKMSQKLGMSTEAYQKWDYVLGQAGTDMASMTTGMKTLTNQIDEAKNGSADAQARFEKLGISMEDLATMSREDVFAATIAGFQGMADSTDRAALANDLFGKSGQNLTPLFNETTESTKELMQAAEDLGMVMSEDAVKASADYQDALDTMQRTLGGLKNTLMSDFLPGITEVMTGLSSIFGGDTEGGIEQITAGIDGLVDNILNALPTVLDLASEIVVGLADAIIENLPKLMDTGVEIIMKLSSAVIDMLPEILRVGLDILVTLCEGIIDALPELIPTLTDVIIEMVDILTQPDMIQRLLECSLQLMIALADGLIRAIPKLLGAIPTIIGNVATALKNSAKELFEPALTWGKDLIDNFVQGIKDKMHRIVDIIKEIAQKIKNLLGFSEPEEGPLSNFHTYAPDMMDLFGEGVKGNEKKLQATVSHAFDFKDLSTAPSIDYKKIDFESSKTNDSASQIIEKIGMQINEIFYNTNGGKAFNTKSEIVNTRELVRAYGT